MRARARISGVACTGAVELPEPVVACAASFAAALPATRFASSVEAAASAAVEAPRKSAAARIGSFVMRCSFARGWVGPPPGEGEGRDVNPSRDHAVPGYGPPMLQ